MGNSESSEQGRSSLITEAKSLLSNGDEAGAFAVLKKAANKGNVMACYDCGFMMIQGIGCEKNWEGGVELMRKGVKLENESENVSWKSNGSVTELLKKQTMDLKGVFFL